MICVRGRSISASEVTMILHAYIVLCMVFNPTLCREQEIVPDDMTPLVSVMDCGRLGFTTRGGLIDSDGAMWLVQGVRCRYEEKRLTDIQQRLRASVSP